MRVIGYAVMVLLAVAMPALAAEAPKAEPTKSEKTGMRTVELRGLNKVTARVSTIKGALGTPLSFGTLDITVRACWTAPADKQPEHAALVEIVENRPDTGQISLFSGWMFASSPTLSALEHPVYDISVLACHTD